MEGPRRSRLRLLRVRLTTPNLSISWIQVALQKGADLEVLKEGTKRLIANAHEMMRRVGERASLSVSTASVMGNRDRQTSSQLGSNLLFLVLAGCGMLNCLVL